MFRLRVNDMKLKEAQDAARKSGMTEKQEAWETELQKGLSLYEQTVQAEIESCGDRPSAHEALNHLIVTGNVLLCDSLEVGKPMRVFPLTRYVVNRDPMGTWIELVIHERVSLRAMPEETGARILAAMDEQGEEAQPNDDSFVDVYTHVLRQGDKYVSYQECKGERIEGTDGEYPLDGCPFIPLRMYWVAGEDYGRSYVENHLGDLKSLEALTQAVIEGSAVSSKVVFLVNPNGTTKATDLQRTPNGGFAVGNANDVAALQVQKAADLRVAFEAIQMLNNRLAKAFMLLDGVRRDAERVTAEEIRAVAAELEAALGGVYSIMSQEFQLPYVRRKIHKLVKGGKLEKLPGSDVNLSIVTGFEALGRGNDKQKLVSYIQTLTQTVGPQAVQQYLNVTDFMSRLAAADGIDTGGLIKTPEEIAAEQRQAQQMQMMDRLGPDLLKTITGAAQGGALSNGMPPAQEQAEAAATQGAVNG